MSTKYKITIEQTVSHTASDGHTWDSTESIEGIVADFDMLTAFIGNVSEIFSDATITLSLIKEDE